MTDYLEAARQGRVTVTTDRLELHTGVRHVGELAVLAAGPIHDPGLQPFGNMWTDEEPGERSLMVLGRWLSKREAWSPQDWSIWFIATRVGEVIGTISLTGRDFDVLKSVTVGLWLGQPHHGRGYGTEMQAAALNFAFAALNADFAVNTVNAENAASLRVNEKLGYAHDGDDYSVVRGERVRWVRARMDRNAWLKNVRVAYDSAFTCD